MSSVNDGTAAIEDVVVHKPHPTQAVIELRGEHDFATEAELRELIGSLVEVTPVVVVDLSNAIFIDSSVLNSLARGHRRASERGSRFRIQLGTATIVRKALEVTGLLERFDCVETREDALISD